MSEAQDLVEIINSRLREGKGIHLDNGPQPLFGAGKRLERIVSATARGTIVELIIEEENDRGYSHQTTRAMPCSQVRLYY